MANPIPIKNIYHMLCYAWNVLEQAELIDVDIADNSNPIDLLAAILVNGANHLLRRGIGQQYSEQEEVISTLRGRVDMANSERRLLLRQGKAICHFDELSPDFLANQIIKATFVRLYRLADLDKDLRHQSGALLKRLSDVQDIRLNRQVFKRVQVQGNNRFYRFLLNVCELIYGECLLDENSGHYRFRDFNRDDGPMAKVYEKFIYNFYDKTQKEYRVSSERIKWDAVSVDDPELSLLPSMLTDISLRSKQRTLIIDAKYYRKTLTSFHGSKTFHSSNLYQINAYLDNLAVNGGNDAVAEGMLLYPVTEEVVSASYSVGSKTIRVESLDLAQDWQGIENDLRELLNKKVPVELVGI